MDWEQLLSWQRLGRDNEREDPERSAFQRDFDRIVFSSAFRRMQDKTQVFPMAESDYVRTRLTHSIEVSSVGRSLGTKVGTLIPEALKKKGLVASHVGEIVAAACLAHDIGNPPFGHSGEKAIGDWFASHPEHLGPLEGEQREDFLKFEGNAQGFRQLTRIQHRHNEGGMQLTCAVLGAFTKYPRGAVLKGLGTTKNVSEKKHGFFADDAARFEQVAKTLGLSSKVPGAWVRHPLAFLVEAADDICYHIVDFEDGHRLGRISFEVAQEHLRPLAFVTIKESDSAYPRIVGGDRVAAIQYLRAQAINTLILAVVEAFKAHMDELLSGKFEVSLIERTPYGERLKVIKELSFKEVYSAPKVVQIEAAGFEVIGGLLNFLVPAMLSLPDKRTDRQKKLLQLVPPEFKGVTKDGDWYARLLATTDFISGMTDTYAVGLYRKLTGMELPRGG